MLLEDLLRIVSRYHCCEDAFIEKIGKNKILEALKFANKDTCIRRALDWKIRKPIKENPDDLVIEKHKKNKKNLDREKAFEYCKTIHERLKIIEGVFVGNNNTDFRYHIVHNVWVFGSMANGSKNPNDLDILSYERQVCKRKKYSECINNQFLNFLWCGMRQISWHDFDVDGWLAEDNKIEIYPKFKLKL